MKDTVVFYKDWYDSTQGLSDEERLAIYDAVMRYAFEGVVPDDKLIKCATALMRSAIDRDNGKYEEVSRKRKEAAEKRWQERRNMQPMQMHTSDANNTNNADNDNVNVNDNVNDNEPTNVGESKEKPSNEGKKKIAPTKVRRFVKPTVEEVEAYCRERSNYVNASHFCDYYESKGWKVGSAPMKDWKAAVRTWEQKDGRKPNKTPSGVTLGVGEWLDERGERRYGTGHTVPMSAPPRPGESSYWSGESQSWVSGV